MYYKRQKKVILLVMGSLAAIMLILGVILAKGNRGKVTEETEAEKYSVTVYKSAGGLIECPSDMVDFEDQKKIVLLAEEGSEIILTVIPEPGKSYGSAEVTNSTTMDVLFNEEEIDGNGELRFEMPAEPVLVHIYYEEDTTLETEEIWEGETETEEKSKVEIYGLSDAILKSYKGCFNKGRIAAAMESFFGIGTPYSDYNAVYKATFLDKEYKKDSGDTVTHYFYFNEDKSWKGLATYCFSDGSYSFRDLKREKEQRKAEKEAARREEEEKARQESEAQAEKEQQQKERETQATRESETQAEASSSPSATQEEVTETPEQVQEYTENVTVDLKNVSEELIEFIGDNGIFDAVTKYVFNSGRRGHFTGTMKQHQLHPKEKTASFTIRLSEGGTIEGTYDKNIGNYSFSGL